MLKANFLILFQRPTREEWQRYLDYFGYKTTQGFIVSTAVWLGVFYGFTYAILHIEIDAMAARGYRRIAHELSALMPLIAYVLIRRDIYRASRKGN